jgi:hypothetical protein
MVFGIPGREETFHRLALVEHSESCVEIGLDIINKRINTGFPQSIIQLVLHNQTHLPSGMHSQLRK